MAAEDAAGARRRLAGRVIAPAGPRGRLPGIGAPAAMTRLAAGVPVVAGAAAAATQRAPVPPGWILASAFRVLVAAHCCWSALLGMNRGSRGDRVHCLRRGKGMW